MAAPEASSSEDESDIRYRSSVTGRTNIHMEESQESPAYPNDIKVWMKDNTGIFKWMMTVQSSAYNRDRGGWDYTVKAVDGKEYAGVAETNLRYA